MSEFLATIRTELDPSGLYQAVALWLPNLLAAAFTVVLFWLVQRGLTRAVSVVMERAKVDRTAISFVLSVLRFAVVTVSLVTALGQLGVDVQGLLASLGVAGLTVGFAARDALSNIISGLFIFWDRPFVIGDLIELGDDYGEVVDITMRTTRVVTPDGRMLAIPNTTIVNSTVASYTNFPTLRLDVDITVGVAEDPQRVRELLLEVVQGDPAFVADKPAQVFVTNLGDFNNTLQLRVWLRDEKQHIAARHTLRERMYNKLSGAGVDMPYETLQVHTAAVSAA